jgi:dTDP-4-dehydrorhamnose 3,5-epimerase-like enzyme
MKNLINLVDLPHLLDDRGSMVAIEGNKNVPFEINRVYYIYNTKAGVARGFHAHKALKQLAVCVSGSCRMSLDDGERRADIVLDSPTQGLIIESMVWREMHDFSDNCVLLVLASDVYDEDDYIRDYDEFVKAVAL